MTPSKGKPVNKVLAEDHNDHIHIRKYKSIKEKKKARQERRNANRAAFCSKHGCNLETITVGNDNREEVTNVASSRPSAKRSKRDTVRQKHRNLIKRRKHIAVALSRDDGIPVNAALAKLINDRLGDLILETVMRIRGAEFTDERAPQFMKSGLVSAGYFLVIPATVESRDWLMSRDLGVLDGKKIVMKLERSKKKSNGKAITSTPVSDE